MAARPVPSASSAEETQFSFDPDFIVPEFGDDAERGEDTPERDVLFEPDPALARFRLRSRGVRVSEGSSRRRKI